MESDGMSIPKCARAAPAEKLTIILIIMKTKSFFIFHSSFHIRGIKHASFDSFTHRPYPKKNHERFREFLFPKASVAFLLPVILFLLYSVL
jgi:hypothetical protein